MANEKELLKNIVLEIAEDLLPTVMKQLDVEDTAVNRGDILALALNKLPTKYVTSSGGKAYTEMVENYRIQYEIDVLASLTRAAMTVKTKPRGTK